MAKPAFANRRKLTAKDLRIRHTADPPRVREYQPRKRGTTHRLGVMEFIWNLFLINETVGVRKKMTDAELQRQIVKEYPHSKIAQRLVEPKIIRPDGLQVESSNKLTVNRLRNLYNRGILSPGLPKPKQPSRRYSDKGQVVNPRTGKPLQ